MLKLLHETHKISPMEGRLRSTLQREMIYINGMTTADKIDVAHQYCMRLLDGRRRVNSRLAAYLGSLIHEPDWTEGEIYDLQMRLILTLAERVALLPDSVTN